MCSCAHITPTWYCMFSFRLHFLSPLVRVLHECRKAAAALCSPEHVPIALAAVLPLVFLLPLLPLLPVLLAIVRHFLAPPITLDTH